VNLWRLTWSHALGVYWMHMRRCDGAAAESWLDLFRQDEPGALYVLSDKAPSLVGVDPDLARHPATL